MYNIYMLHISLIAFILYTFGKMAEEEKSVEPDAPPLGTGRIKTVAVEFRNFQ